MAVDEGVRPFCGLLRTSAARRTPFGLGPAAVAPFGLWPAAVADYQVTPKDGSAVASWTAPLPLAVAAPAISGYNVTLEDANGTVIASGTTPSDSSAWGLTGTSPGNVYWMGSQAVAAGTVGALTLNRLIGGEHPEDSQQHTLSGSGSPSYASSHTMQSSATSGASRPYLSRSFYLQGRNNGAHLSSEAAAVAKLAYGDLHQLDTNMGSAACHVDAYTILQFRAAGAARRSCY